MKKLTERFAEAAAKGDTQAMHEMTPQIERVRQMFGFNYTTSTKFLDDYNERGVNGKEMTKEDFKKYSKNPGSYESPEKQLAILTEQIKADTAKIAAWSLDEKIDALQGVHANIENELGGGSNPPKPIGEMDRLNSIVAP